MSDTDSRSLTLLERTLAAAARLTCRRYRLLLGLALLLTLLAPLPLLFTGYTTAFNLTRMLPQDIPAARAFTRALTDFGTADEALVAFRLNPENPRALDLAGKIADRAALRLIQNPAIATAFARLLTREEKDQLLNVELPRHGMLLLTPADIEAVKTRLQPDRIRRSMEAAERRLASDTLPEEQRQKLLINILGIGSIFQESLSRQFRRELPGTLPAANADAALRNPLDGAGYLVSPRGDLLLLVIEPKYPAQSIPFSAWLMEFVEQSIYDCMLGAAPLTTASCADWPKFFTVFQEPGPAARALFDLLTNDERKQVRECIRSEDPEVLEQALQALNRLLRTREAAQILAASPELQPLLQAQEEEVKELAANGMNPDRVRAALLLRLNTRLFSAAHKWISFRAPDGGEPLPTAALNSFQVEFAGGYQIARRYGEKIHQAVIVTLLTSAAAVLLLLGLCFRRRGAAFYIGVPLLMVLSWTGAAGWLLFGQLNLVTCAFAAVLAGLGIDYGVHLYNRYVEERNKGSALERAFEIALTRTGRGVLIGMAATSLAFLALNAARFTQLAEFGVLGAVGIALSAPAMILLMPALIAWRTRKHGEDRLQLSPPAFALPALATFLTRRRKGVVILAVVLATLCALLLLLPGSVMFDADLAALRPGDRAYAVNGDISESFASRNPNKLTFLVLGANEEEALDRMASYEPRLHELQQRGLIRGYESISAYLPAPQEQRQRLELLRGIDFNRALADFRAAIKERSGDESYFKFNLDLLRQHARLVQQNKIILPADFRGTKIARLVNRYVARRQKEYNLALGERPARYPVTLAKPAVQSADNVLRYPAEAVLTREAVEGLNPPGQSPQKQIKTITVYEGGCAVKATIYPPVLPGSKDGEPHITQDWLRQVSDILGLEPQQFEAKPDPRDPPAALTGVAVASVVLAQVAQEDLLRIGVLTAIIGFLIVNLFFHKRPGQAALCTVPMLLVAGLFPQLQSLLPALEGTRLWCALGCALVLLPGALLHRRAHLALLCFLPVALGLLYLSGLMAAVNLIAEAGWGCRPLSLNLVSALVLPVLFGVGINNGIHLVNRYLESGRELPATLLSTGRALLITALTGIGGFASLGFCHLQGLDSVARVGLLCAVAFPALLAASLLATLPLLTLLLPGRGAGDSSGASTRISSRSRKPSDGAES